MFKLRYNDSPDADLHCPKCKQGFNVAWDTEYGDPLVGDHSATCLACKEVFTFDVYHKYVVIGDKA